MTAQAVEMQALRKEIEAQGVTDVLAVIRMVLELLKLIRELKGAK